ncbi:uncharacterized protein PODANS_1_2960 [Podospora anserina S mat+]|uniref:Podospora anserina S mat+ genomic DNA chromosome 1, supercontig 1 n=1 Tax=Podospora anserina (strain S / ATCC MYA-4624 / DSM 980 / FGSC 10383) TaxID=515849 RepID=B2AA62_PODAN|nr:uncharacterized protein PODANS_1_2960 [Podospora anserina S mat+]CAP59973.1 unnamed protein product [Podospora anserina S mat+]CDP22615.1 Putative protein of unknown function [Podospora anserina S mat+]
MRLPCILTLGSASVVLAEDQPRNQKPLSPHPGTVTTPPQKFMSCSKTYGPDWETCGDEATSRFCYSPAQGQSCCAVDNGYCEKGTWCAPVAGYCCLDGENLESCAQSAGFELPGSESSYLPSLKRSVSLLEDREVVVGEVKVSVAAKKKTLVGLGLGMGVVGLLMLSC